MICVVDYGRGNLFSIGRALDVLGLKYQVTEDADTVAAASRVILPGVGAFGGAMEIIRERGIDSALCEVAARGDQIVGICLGEQMLATRSFEFGEHAGLNLIPGDVVRLKDPAHGQGTRIPNIGWREVTAHNRYDALERLGHRPYFYFIHSYHVRCAAPEHVVGTIEVNGDHVPAIIRKENIWGFQFHPEKSGQAGLALLGDTLRI